MKCSLRFAPAFCFVVLFFCGFCARTSVAQEDGWRAAVEKPITALFMFKGSFRGNGQFDVVVGGVTNSLNNFIEGYSCTDNEWDDTGWKEVSLTLDEVYHCTISGEDAYGFSAAIKRVPLHKILDGGGAFDRQFNLYKLYIFNPVTAGWEKLCPENSPTWAIDEESETCHSHSISFDIQLRRDFGARPVVRPGLKSLDGDEEPEVWTSETGGVAAGTAPGDETPLRISVPRNGDAWSMERNWAVSLGRLWSGGSAGRIRLQGNLLSAEDFTRKAIVYTSPTLDTNEVQIRTSLSDTNEIVQIRTPQTLVLTTNTSSMSFEMRFYLPTQITGQDGNGFYTISNHTNVFVTWRVDSPASSTNSYRISEVRPWITNLTTLTYTNASNLWTLVRGTGADARIETRTVAITTSTNGAIITTNRLEVQEIKNGAGTVATKNAEVFKSKPWGQFELTTVTNDPGGDNLVTTFTYGEDPVKDGSYRQIIATTWPNGYWEIRDYFNEGDTFFDLSGRLRYKVTPWKNTAFTTDTNDWLNCRLTEYVWEFDGDDEFRGVSGSYVTSPGAYTMVEWHGGTDYSNRLYVDQLKYIEICQDTTQIKERHQYGDDQHYGEVVDVLNYTLDAGPLAGQVSSKLDWMLVKDSYDYIYGDYNLTNRTFVENTNGIDTIQIVYHGGEGASGDLIISGESGFAIDPIVLQPNLGTKDVNYLDDGQLVLSRRYVYTGGDTNYALIDEVVYQRDALGHTTNVFRIDPATGQSRTLRQANWTGTNAYPSDLKQWEIDEHGSKTTFTYDTLKRVKTVVRAGISVAGYPTQTDITNTFAYDAADRVLSAAKTASGGLSEAATTAYDKSGRVIMTVDAAGLTNRIGYQFGGQQTSVTNGSGATKIVLNYLDRRPASITGTAQVNEFFDYDLTLLGFNDALYPKSVTWKTLGSTNSARWSNTATDQRYKPAQEQIPQFQNTNVIHKEFIVNNPWNKGYFIEYKGFWDPRYPVLEGLGTDLRRTFWQEFNRFGQKILEGWDSNTNRFVTTSQTDRVHTFASHFETNSSGHWFHISEEFNHIIDNSSDSNLFSRVKVRLTGFSSTEISEVVTADVHTNETVQLTTIDFGNRLVSLRTTYPQSSLSATQAVLNGLVQYESTASVASPAWHYYDSLGREIATKDPLGFISGSRLSATTGQLLAVTNKNGQVVSYQYYPPGSSNAGLLYCETNPTGKKTYYGYNARGQQTQVWGDVPYPEQREFNDFGDLVSLSTYRGAAAWNGTNWPASPGTADVTTWGFDEPTGLLTNKTDAASQAVFYSYFLTREPKSRTWARGDSSTNTFELNGDLWQTDLYGAQNYSVITSNYNRFGLPRLVIDNSGEHELEYDYAGRLIEDRCVNGLMAGTTVKLRYHPVYGKDQVIVQAVAGSVTNSVTNTFGFDGYGRIAGVTNGNQHASYAYLADSDLINTTTSRSGGSAVSTTTRQWDFGYRLRNIDNVVAGSSVSRHGYVHDALDRRRRATLADGSAWEYRYNDRDEVTAASRFWSDFMPVAGQRFEFAYDSIGNRTVAKEGGDTNGANLRAEGYRANNLNQYTVRTNAPYNEVQGAAYATATVTVNGTSTVRKGEYFEHPLASGTNVALWQPITNTATLGANSTTETGGLALPPLIQAFEYDLDGNMIFDGVWTYHWDAENRLVQQVMTNLAGVPNDRRYRLNYDYDKQGRRFTKIVSTWNGSAFANAQTNCYLYDGWNLMIELDATNAPLRSYTWGLDLTGSLEDAGGIGALLMLTEHTNSAAAHFYGYDGNGNVTILVKTDGTITARYEYGPFGEMLRLSGFLAEANPFCFSTKFTDSETGLNYYGHRYYSSELGKWLGRDSIEEDGGLNLTAFVENSPVNSFDFLGQNTGNMTDVQAGTSGSSSMAANLGVRIGAQYRKIKDKVDAFNDYQEMLFNAWDIMDSLDIPGADDILIEAMEKGNRDFAGELKKEKIPFEKHHVGTNKGRHKWNSSFATIFKMMGFDSSAELNQIPAAGHGGRHKNDYHSLIFDRLDNALKKGMAKGGFKGARKAFVRELINIRKEIASDPSKIKNAFQ